VRGDGSEASDKLAEAIRAVFDGEPSYTAAEVLKELRARGMCPQVADPLGAIRYALAAGSDFERVPGERDRYRLALPREGADHGRGHPPQEPPRSPGGSADQGRPTPPTHNEAGVSRAPTRAYVGLQAAASEHIPNGCGNRGDQLGLEAAWGKRRTRNQER